MKEDFKVFIFVICFVICLVFVTFILPVSLGYYSSCVKANIFNMQNSSSFTCSDFFWAEDQINSKTQTIKIR